MNLINMILDKGYNIEITCDARRTDKDNTGKKLPHGRDFYALYNYKLSNEENSIKSDWPGFYDSNGLIKDLRKVVKKLK